MVRPLNSILSGMKFNLSCKEEFYESQSASWSLGSKDFEIINKALVKLHFRGCSTGPSATNKLRSRAVAKKSACLLNTQEPILKITSSLSENPIKSLNFKHEINSNLKNDGLLKVKSESFSKDLSQNSDSCDTKSSDFAKPQISDLARFKRRTQRCAFKEETVCEQLITGKLKRYNLKGRFGKIVFGNQKINVYEDDLVISGVNLRKFKEKVRSKCDVWMSFSLKSGWEEDEKKVRPVNIQVRYESLEN